MPGDSDTPRSGPVTTRGPSPPTSCGARVRHSSSSRPAAATAASKDGPPSQSTRLSPRSARVVERSRQVDSIVAGDHDVGDRSQPVAGPGIGAGVGDDDGALGAAVEQLGGRVEVEPSRDESQHRGGSLTQRRAHPGVRRLGTQRAVALGAGGAGTDEHDVGEPAQDAEDLLVGGAGEPFGAAVPDRRAVQRRRPCSRAARVGRSGSGRRRSGRLSRRTSGAAGACA